MVNLGIIGTVVICFTAMVPISCIIIAIIKLIIYLCKCHMRYANNYRLPNTFQEVYSLQNECTIDNPPTYEDVVNLPPNYNFALTIL